MLNHRCNSKKKKVDKTFNDFLFVVTKLIKYTHKISKFLAICLYVILDGISSNMYNIIQSIAIKSLLISSYVYFLYMIHSLKSFETCK